MSLPLLYDSVRREGTPRSTAANARNAKNAGNFAIARTSRGGPRSSPTAAATAIGYRAYLFFLAA